MKILRILTLLICVLYCWGISGQNSTASNLKTNIKYVKHLDLRLENGTMLGNGNEIGNQLVKNIYYNGIDIRFGFRKTDKNDVYSNIYRRPFMGLGFYSSTFHNSDVGNPSALYFFLTHPLVFEQNKRLTFNYSMAFGFSYNFNPFDSINNPTNIFIGSSQNCYVHMGLSANIKISDKWLANATLGLKHFSNGSFKKPNFGINLIPLTVGVSYKISDQKIDHFAKPIPEFQKYNLLNIIIAGGSKNYADNEPNYLKMNFGLNYLRAIKYKYRIGIGIDIFYTAKSGFITEPDKEDFSNAVSLAVVPNWEWVISKKVYVPLGIGFYVLHIENDESSRFYERAGIRYMLTDHLAAGITIKAHKDTADFFEWALVYTLNNDNNQY
jgi:hypothetical protein